MAQDEALALALARSLSGPSDISSEGMRDQQRELLLDSLVRPVVTRQPLVPGTYCVLPRAWLRRWRHFMRDPASA